MMTLSTKEVPYARTRKNSTYQICNRYPVGFYFHAVGGIVHYPNLVMTHFVACYGNKYRSENNCDIIRRIEEYCVMDRDAILGSSDTYLLSAFQDHLDAIDSDRQQEHFHVFRLGESMPVRPDMRIFKGSDHGYKRLIDFI